MSIDRAIREREQRTVGGNSADYSAIREVCSGIIVYLIAKEDGMEFGQFYLR